MMFGSRSLSLDLFFQVNIQRRNLDLVLSLIFLDYGHTVIFSGARVDSDSKIIRSFFFMIDPIISLSISGVKSGCL